MEDKDILAEDRRRKILDLLDEQGTVKTAPLAERFSVSEVTIRRDLEELAGEGKLKKVHGGAVTKERNFRPSYQGNTIAFEPSFQQKRTVNEEEKERIGALAASLVKREGAVFIGGGSTTMAVVDNLDPKTPFTAVTNSLKHASALLQFSGVEVFVTGGQLRRSSSALVGPAAKRSLDNLYIDTFFLGVNGISLEHGLTVPSLAEAELAQSVVEISNEVVVVADYSKFGKVSHAKITELPQVDVVVTDEGAKGDFEEELEEAGVRYLFA